MARTVEKKWSTEESSDYPSRINTGWNIKTQISWDNNIPRGRLGGVRFELTTEGCDEPCLSLKAWCARAKIRKFTEDSRSSLDNINIRRHINFKKIWHTKLMPSQISYTTIKCDVWYWNICKLIEITVYISLPKNISLEEQLWYIVNRL